MTKPSNWQFGKQFSPEPYGLSSVISIASEGAVIAHVNCAFGNGEANARLIAAAPDLLAALRECMTENGAHCLAYGSDTPKLRARIAVINMIVGAALAKVQS